MQLTYVPATSISQHAKAKILEILDEFPLVLEDILQSPRGVNNRMWSHRYISILFTANSIPYNASPLYVTPDGNC